jgi:periplasmic copper chaperone A
MDTADPIPSSGHNPEESMTMSIHPVRRRSVGALVITAVFLAVAAPVVGLPTIPESELVSSDQRQLIHVRIQTGCDELPTDQVEVQIPEGVVGVVPEAVPGWTVETEVAATDPYELFGETQNDRVALVRWLGGSVPADQFADFGIAAVFREAPAELAFPVTQLCGSEELAWTEVPEEGQDPADLAFPAPVVTVAAPGPSVDLAALQETVEAIDAQAKRLATRVNALEEKVQALEARLGSPSPEP